MAEAPIYFYETQIDWHGDKDLQIASGKLPAIAVGESQRELFCL